MIWVNKTTFLHKQSDVTSPDITAVLLFTLPPKFAVSVYISRKEASAAFGLWNTRWRQSAMSINISDAQITLSGPPLLFFCKAPWANLNRELKDLEMEVIGITSRLEINFIVERLTSRVSLAVRRLVLVARLSLYSIR